MCEWKIEYMQGYSIGRFKFVEADMIRMGGATGDIWFCDKKDKMPGGDYIPKLIIAKGVYLSVEKVEPNIKEGMKKKVEFTKTETVEWV
jgi:hypothetical protein